MKAAFIGYGELGIQIQHYAAQLYDIDSAVYFDDKLFAQKAQNSFPFSSYENKEYADWAFFIGLGYQHLPLRRKIISKLASQQRHLPNIVHPTSYIDSLAVLGRAVYIYPMCTLDKEVVVADGVILNNGVTVSHNSRLGESCYLSPRATLAGRVSIGSETFVGTGVLVSNNITIGSSCVLGIGSVITSDLQNGSHCIGNPAKTKDHLNLK